MALELIFLILWFLNSFSLLLTTFSYSSQEIVNINKFSPNKFPVKIDLEATRTYKFMKVAVFLKNHSLENYLLKLKLIIIKKEKRNLSKIFQAKEIYLQGNEIALPFIAEFSVKATDYYEIHLQVFDEKGNLLLEKTLQSEPLEA